MALPPEIRAALLLTNRLVSLPAAPLTAREFWAVVDAMGADRLGDLLGLDPPEIAAVAEVDAEQASRFRRLLDASTAFEFEAERLAESGVDVIAALDARFPPRLRALGERCPSFVVTAGPLDWLHSPGLGVMSAPDDSESVARAVASVSVDEGWPLISGLSAGPERSATMAAIDLDGVTIGVPAAGILPTSREAQIRSLVHAGQLCLVSPFPPDFSPRGGFAHHQLVYAMTRVALVVVAGDEHEGVWSGAADALDRRLTSVAVWAGPGAAQSNAAFARRGAHPVDDVAQLIELPPSEFWG